MGAEKAVGIIGAILGGYSSGVIQAELERQKREEELQLQAMRLATTRSSLQTGALQQEKMRQDIDFARSPEALQAMQDESYGDRQRLGWAREDTERERTQTEAAGVAREFTGLQLQRSGQLTSEGVPTGYADVGRPQFSARVPAPGPMLDGMFQPGQQMLTGTKPGREEAGVTFAPLEQATQEQMTSFAARQPGTQFQITDGQIIPTMLSAQEREAQGLTLSQLRANVATAQTDARVAQATAPSTIAGEAARARTAQTAARIGEATEDDVVSAASSLAESGELNVAMDQTKLDAANFELESAEDALALAYEMILSGTPEQQAEGVAFVLGEGYSTSIRGLTPEAAELERSAQDIERRGQDTQLAVADMQYRGKMAEVNVDNYANWLREKELELATAKFEGTAAGGATPEQRTAMQSAMKFIQEYYDRATDVRKNQQGVAPGSARVLMATVIPLMRQAGPMSRDIALAVRAAHQLMWESLPVQNNGRRPPESEEWTGVSYDEFNRIIAPYLTEDFMREHGVTPTARSGAAPLPGRSSQPRRQGGPPGSR